MATDATRILRASASSRNAVSSSKWDSAGRTRAATSPVKARKPVWASEIGWPPMREARAAEIRLVSRRPNGMATVRSRAPRTRSARPAATGATRRGISSGGCWPSASSVTITDAPPPLHLPPPAPRAAASATPVRRAAPLPRLVSCRTTVAPAADAADPVPSVEPSSTTITRAAGTVARVRATTAPTFVAAWNAGTTTAIRTSARSGMRRGAAFHDGEHRLQLGAQVAHRLGRQRAPGLGLQLAAAAVLLDLLPRPLDGVLLRVEQVLDEHDQLDLAPLVDAVARAVLGGVQEPELALPVAQHVRLQVGELADLADGEELLPGMGSAHRHCSALRSRSISAAMASRGAFPSNRVAATTPLSCAAGGMARARSPPGLPAGAALMLFTAPRGPTPATSASVMARRGTRMNSCSARRATAWSAAATATAVGWRW